MHLKGRIPNCVNLEKRQASFRNSFPLQKHVSPVLSDQINGDCSVAFTEEGIWLKCQFCGTYLEGQNKLEFHESKCRQGRPAKEIKEFDSPDEKMKVQDLENQSLFTEHGIWYKCQNCGAFLKGKTKVLNHQSKCRPSRSSSSSSKENDLVEVIGEENDESGKSSKKKTVRTTTKVPLDLSSPPSPKKKVPMRRSSCSQRATTVLVQDHQSKGKYDDDLFDDLITYDDDEPKEGQGSQSEEETKMDNLSLKLEVSKEDGQKRHQVSRRSATPKVVVVKDDSSLRVNTREVKTSKTQAHKKGATNEEKMRLTFLQFGMRICNKSSETSSGEGTATRKDLLDLLPSSTSTSSPSTGKERVLKRRSRSRSRSQSQNQESCTAINGAEQTLRDFKSCDEAEAVPGVKVNMSEICSGSMDSAMESSSENIVPKSQCRNLKTQKTVSRVQPSRQAKPEVTKDGFGFLKKTTQKENYPMETSSSSHAKPEGINDESEKEDCLQESTSNENQTQIRHLQRSSQTDPDPGSDVTPPYDVTRVAFNLPEVKIVLTRVNVPKDKSTPIKIPSAEKKPLLFAYFKKATKPKEFSFKNLNNLKKKSTNLKDTKTFCCNYLDCGKRFNNRFALELHIRTHTGERPFKCKYRKCKKSFSQITNLRNHERTHTGEKPYMCHWCKKCFSHISNLKVHERLHTGVMPYKCEVCAKKFAQQSNWGWHMKTYHKELLMKSEVQKVK